jgi:hypothetical protein
MLANMILFTALPGRNRHLHVWAFKRCLTNQKAGGIKIKMVGSEGGNFSAFLHNTSKRIHQKDSKL